MKVKYYFLILLYLKFGEDGATRPLPRDGGANEFRGDPTIGLRLTSGPEIEDGSAKDGAPKRLRCSNIPPSHRGGAVPAPLPRGGPKWWDKFLEGSPPIFKISPFQPAKHYTGNIVKLHS